MWCSSCNLHPVNVKTSSIDHCTLRILAIPFMFSPGLHYQILSLSSPIEQNHLKLFQGLSLRPKFCINIWKGRKMLWVPVGKRMPCRRKKAEGLMSRLPTGVHFLSPRFFHFLHAIFLMLSFALGLQTNLWEVQWPHR